MALSNVPIAFARGIVAAFGTSVAAVNGAAALFPVPDNCHTVLVTNPSATLTGLVGVGLAGTTVLTAGSNAQRVPPGTTLTLSVGTQVTRGPLNVATLALSGLIYDSIGGNVTLEITYICQLGTP